MLTHVLPDFVVMGEEGEVAPNGEFFQLHGDPFVKTPGLQILGKNLQPVTFDRFSESEVVLWAVGGWANWIRLAWFCSELTSSTKAKINLAIVIESMPCVLYSEFDSVLDRRRALDDGLREFVAFWSWFIRGGRVEKRFDVPAEFSSASELGKIVHRRLSMELQLFEERKETRVSSLDDSLLRVVATNEGRIANVHTGLAAIQISDIGMHFFRCRISSLIKAGYIESSPSFNARDTFGQSRLTLSPKGAALIGGKSTDHQMPDLQLGSFLISYTQP